ncbi:MULTISPECIES: hypothetical protein [unclassified Lacinutrix]
MEKKDLIYICPIVILTIFLKYISLTKKKADPLFILALLAFLSINILTFYSFKDYFISIALLTAGYLLLYTLILKKYLNKGKLKSIVSLSVLIGVMLVGYVIYSVVDLLIGHIPDQKFIFVILVATCLFVYSITFAVIYINDNYANGTILLASGVCTIFNLALAPINEYFFYNKTFTVLLLFCHFLAIYLFMIFISKTKVIEAKDFQNDFFEE